MQYIYIIYAHYTIHSFIVCNRLCFAGLREGSQGWQILLQPTYFHSYFQYFIVWLIIFMGVKLFTWLLLLFTFAWCIEVMKGKEMTHD